MVVLVCRADGAGDAGVDWHRRPGDQPRSRHVGARLADNLWLQHVSVPDQQMAGRDFLRALPPAARFARRPDDDGSCRLALAQGFAPLDALAWRDRVSPRRGAGRARRIARDAAHGFAGHFSRDDSAIVFCADLRDCAVHQPVVGGIGAPASGTARTKIWWTNRPCRRPALRCADSSCSPPF